MKGTFRKNSFFVKVLLLGIVVFLFLGHQEGKSAPVIDQETYRNLKVFNEVFDLVKKNYVEEVDSKSLLQGAIDGMIRSLDPHSTYMTREMYRDLQVDTRGEFGGLGIEITKTNDYITVVSPIEDTPAFKAGVKAGDQIVGIEGKSTKGLNIIDAVHQLRGPKGTPVTITILRKGLDKPLDIAITRDTIKIVSVKYNVYEQNIGYIRLSTFHETTAEELQKVLNKQVRSAKQPLAGLILDLRNNPGGLLDQAIRVVDIFLKSGVIVSSKGKSEDSETSYTAQDDGNEPDLPIVVLINGGSASASEIVAGALHDNGRALLLGTQTFGKGSVQVVIPLEDGSALKLTTAKYYTPNGKSIQATGIVPDILIDFIPPDDEKLSRIREKDLKGHIEGEGLELQTSSDEEGNDDLRNDNQLRSAINLIQKWEILKKI